MLSAVLSLAAQRVVAERGESPVDVADGGWRRGERNPADEGAQKDTPIGDLLESLGRAVAPDRTRRSARDRFLGDLGEMRSEEGTCWSVEFEESGSLPAIAEGVLKEYARVPSVDLIASGYLDLKGNVWGAVLRGGTSWCDVLLVSTGDDAVSRVRVTRTTPEGEGV